MCEFVSDTFTSLNGKEEEWDGNVEWVWIYCEDYGDDGGDGENTLGVVCPLDHSLDVKYK